jgi:hypothetical protein
MFWKSDFFLTLIAILPFLGEVMQYYADHQVELEFITKYLGITVVVFGLAVVGVVGLRAIVWAVRVLAGVAFYRICRLASFCWGLAKSAWCFIFCPHEGVRAYGMVHGHSGDACWRTSTCSEYGAVCWRALSTGLLVDVRRRTLVQ